MVDLVIAVAMIMLLKDTDSVDGVRYRASKRSAGAECFIVYLNLPILRISRTMRRLTVIIVNTGLVTAVVAIISLILVSVLLLPKL